MRIANQGTPGKTQTPSSKKHGSRMTETMRKQKRAAGMANAMARHHQHCPPEKCWHFQTAKEE